MEECSDAEDIVELSTNPLDDLPPSLVRSLEGFVYVPDEDLAGDRIWLLDLLAKLWFDLAHEEDGIREHWVEAHRGRPFVQGIGEDGTLQQTDGSPLEYRPGLAVHCEVDAELVDQLIQEILEVTGDDLVIRTSAFMELMQDWNSQNYDPEKLIGHLVRGHAQGADVLPLDDEALFEVHVRLHANSPA